MVIASRSFVPPDAHLCYLLLPRSPCDTGSPRQVLEQDREFDGFDLSLLTPDWTSKQGQFAADENSLNARAQWVRQFVRSRPEKNILLVGHGDIIRRITGRPEGNSTHAWKNAEVRTFEFDQKYIDTPQAWLHPGGTQVAAGGWEPTSTEFAGGDAAGAGAAGAVGGAGGLLPSIGTGESGSLDVGGSILAELEGKIAQKQESVQTKAKELDELEARLQQAEARKQALEAKGIRM